MDCISDTGVPLPLMSGKQYKLPAYYLLEDKLVVKKNGAILDKSEYTVNKEWIEPIMIKSFRDHGAPMCLNDNYYHIESSEKTPHSFMVPITDDLSVSYAYYVHSSTSSNAVNGTADFLFNNSTTGNNYITRVYLCEGRSVLSTTRARNEEGGNLMVQYFRGTGESNRDNYYCIVAVDGMLYVLNVNASTKSMSWIGLGTIYNYRIYATNMFSPSGKYYLRGYDSASESSSFYKMTGDPFNTGSFSMSGYSRPNISKMTKVIRFHPSNDELIYNQSAYEYFLYKVDEDTWYDRSYIDLNTRLELGAGHPQIVTYSDTSQESELSRETIKVYLDFNPLEDIERAKECFCMPCDSTHMRFQYPELYQGVWRTVSRKLVKVDNEWLPERITGFVGIQAGVQNDPEHSYWLYDTHGKSDTCAGKIEERQVPSSITIPGAQETDVITVDYTLNYIPKDINRKVTITQSIEFIPAIE